MVDRHVSRIYRHQKRKLNLKMDDDHDQNIDPIALPAQIHLPDLSLKNTKKIMTDTVPQTMNYTRA